MSLQQPLGQCSKIFMLHMNFHSRAAEHGDKPQYPVYHLKPPSTLTASNTPIVMPPGVHTMLGEAEIAVIIGRTARDVPEAEALSYVSHVAAANDVTVFDYGWSDAPSLVRSKGFDTFTPVGKLIPIADIDPTNLTVRLTVNGVRRQQAHSSDLIFDFARLVAELSAIMTLNPGDMILTGTPAGAPLLAVGDEVVVDLNGISTSTNIVAADQRAPDPLIPQPCITPRGRAVSIGAACHRLCHATVADLARLVDAGFDAIEQAAQSLGHATTPLAVAEHGRDIAGHAFTLRQVPARDSDGPPAAATAFKALHAVGPGEVIVAEGSLTQNDRDTLLDRVTEKGAAGVIAAAPPSEGTLHRPVAVNTPISINGVTVMPGDILVSLGGETKLLAGDIVDHLLEVLS